MNEAFKGDVLTYELLSVFSLYSVFDEMLPAFLTYFTMKRKFFRFGNEYHKSR